ncbi:AbrB family transcriptional regulator [Pararhodobacter sp.]|uniref:AbrB family transcriptional regulator n=1 Tax=Pararhodobacter sp. TaxID=2127056 RepID=UPI002AFFE9DE|nr:AbrB family transcriptional regulator [Pararhodobacter sp.]
MPNLWGLDAPRLTAIAAASVGVGVFLLFGWPLPFLFGPMAGCLLASLAGAKLRGMGSVGDGMRTILGVAVGAAITPALIQDLPRMAVTLSLIPVYLIVVGALGYPLLRRGFGLDHATAWYGAMPGGLQDMMIFGEEAGGDPRALSLLHATRVMMVVMLAPPLLWAFWGVDLHSAPGQPASSTPVGQLALMLVAALGGWRLAKAVGLFGASILGPMIATAVLSLSGFITMRPPAEAIWAAQVFIGLAVGVRYSGVSFYELRRFVLAGALLSMLLALLTVAFAEGIYLANLAPQLEAFMAFAPGGQAEMTVLALLAGADLAFIVAHHVLRIVLVITLSPVIDRLWLRKR